jgi:diguanylate cyclase (GGDEF)-like protein
VTALVTLGSIHLTRKYEAERTLAYGVCLIFAGVCTVALMAGGVGNSGLFWSFMLPMLAYPTLGISMATLLLAGHLAVILMIFYGDVPLSWIANYPTDTKLRFLVTLSVILMVNFFKELSRKANIDELEATSRKLERLAHTDELTGLLNRRAMREKLAYEMKRADRGNTPLSLILCDIDHFKKINDQYGHDAGDEALKQIAQCINNTLRQSDFASRWGGEEFLILLPMTAEGGAFVMAERLRLAIAALPISTGADTFSLTMSFGLAMKTGNISIDEMIKKSDINLYLAKENGRNQTCPVIREAELLV